MLQKHWQTRSRPPTSSSPLVPAHRRLSHSEDPASDIPASNSSAGSEMFLPEEGSFFSSGRDASIFGEVRHMCLRTWILTVRSHYNPAQLPKQPRSPSGQATLCIAGLLTGVRGGTQPPPGGDLGLETFLPLSLASAGGPTRCGAGGGVGGEEALGLTF